VSDESTAPPESDAQSVELLRAWVVGQELHCSLDAGAFRDADTWGVVLADLARHVARALKEQEGQDEAATLLAVRAAFEAELLSPGGGPEEGADGA
jgi:Domain of unknown function (DUF5076)